MLKSRGVWPLSCTCSVEIFGRHTTASPVRRRQNAGNASCVARSSCCSQGTPAACRTIGLFGPRRCPCTRRARRPARSPKAPGRTTRPARSLAYSAWRWRHSIFARQFAHPFKIYMRCFDAFLSALIEKYDNALAFVSQWGFIRCLRPGGSTGPGKRGKPEIRFVHIFVE